MLSDRATKRGLNSAVRHFWETRSGQARNQHSRGTRDQGSRSAVTGGKQMDGFVTLVARIITDAGLPSNSLHVNRNLELPGYFRPEKKWDLVVIQNDTLVSAVEFKSQIGPSFGNNFNNRSEEAIGTAQDVWTAYREGAFSSTTRPWLGYLMLLEDCEKSTSPVAVREPHFPVFKEFVGASYSERYQQLMIRLIRERLYDSASLLLSSKPSGSKVGFMFPNADLEFGHFAGSLSGHVAAFVSRCG